MNLQHGLHSMKVSFSIGTLIVIGLLFAGPLYSQTDPTPVVRAVQIVPDAPPVDLYLDDVTPASIAEVRYLDASRSLRLPAGTHNIKIAASGAPKESAVINQNVVFNTDTGYTIFATGRLGALNVQPVVLTRWLGQTPTPGRSLVRVMHGALEAGNVDITITDAISQQTHMNGIAFRSATDYTAVPAGPLEVTVRASGGNEIYKATGNIPDGVLLTIVAVGDPGSSSFKLSVLVDSDSLARTPMDTLRAMTANPIGNIRFVHVSPDMGTGDILVSNQPEPSDISFREASSNFQHEAGSYNVKVIEQGGTTVVDTEADVIADFQQTGYVVGTIADGTMGLLVLTTDGSAQPGAGKSSIRLLNAATDLGLANIEIEYSDNSERQIESSGFRNFTPYQQVAPGTTTVRVTQIDSTNPVLVASGNVPSGAIGTLVLTGRLSEGNLGVNLLIENDPAAQAPMILFQSVSGVNTEESIVSSMEVVPNPVRDRATLRISLERPTALSCEIHSITGEKVFELDFGQREAGEERVDIEFGQLPVGSYVVVLRDGEGRSIGMTKMEVVGR